MGGLGHGGFGGGELPTADSTGQRNGLMESFCRCIETSCLLRAFIEVPRVAKPAPHCRDSMGKVAAELVAAAAGRLVAHDYATLEQQFLDVAQAQVEAEGSAYRATDDHCRKAVAVIERCLLHRPILRDLANVTVPSSRP